MDVEDPLSSDEEENFEVVMRLVKEQVAAQVEGGVGHTVWVGGSHRVGGVGRSVWVGWVTLWVG